MQTQVTRFLFDCHHKTAEMSADVQVDVYVFVAHLSSCILLAMLYINYIMETEMGVM